MLGNGPPVPIKEESIKQLNAAIFKISEEIARTSSLLVYAEEIKDLSQSILNLCQARDWLKD